MRFRFRLRRLVDHVKRDALLRGVLLYVAITGPLALGLKLALSPYLAPEALAALDAALLALLAGGFIFVLVQGSLRRGEDEIIALRSDSERFRSLTALSADWFWETDAEHRLTWLSGGAPVMMIFGQGAGYGKRFWEAPGVEVEPEALARHLEARRAIRTGRVVGVFGAGGDRDRGKRATRGEIATRLDDIAIVTADNPRTEDPERILDEVEAGMGASHHREVDRRRAIALALSLVREGDTLLLAGKGHETYQVLGTTKQPFDERLIIGELGAA